MNRVRDIEISEHGTIPKLLDICTFSEKNIGIGRFQGVEMDLDGICREHLQQRFEFQRYLVDDPTQLDAFFSHDLFENIVQCDQLHAIPIGLFHEFRCIQLGTTQFPESNGSLIGLQFLFHLTIHSFIPSHGKADHEMEEKELEEKELPVSLKI